MFSSLLTVLTLVAILFTSAIVVNSVYAWKFAAVGDIECSGAKKIANFIKQFSPDVKRVLLLGDLGYSSTSKCISDAFRAVGLNVLPTVGNHDSASNIQSVFGKGSGIGTYKTENVRFLSINTELSISSVKSKVAGLLNKYKNDSSIDFIIPYAHKAWVTSNGAHHGEGEARGYRAALNSLFVDSGKVELVLFGHNHGYQQCTDKGIDYITSGMGGRKPYAWGSGTDDQCKNSMSGRVGYLEGNVSSNEINWKLIHTSR